MRKMTSSDRGFGPFTIGPWTKTISATLSSGDEDDAPYGKLPQNSIRIVAFGWAIRMWLPFRLLKPLSGWDGGEVEYGICLSDMGNGYDFLTVRYGPQTNSSDTTKSWSWFLPWKQWRHIHTSYYDDNLNHFFTAGRGCGFLGVEYTKQKACPQRHFEIEDCDGKRVIASTRIEEREWKFGSGWFKWLSWFRQPKIRRSIWIEFSDETGPEKGSWKGGTMGTGEDMSAGETHEQAMRRYCSKEHESKGRKYTMKFIGPCSPPPQKPEPQHQDDCVKCECASK